MAKASDKSGLTIRRARKADAARLADLSGQLGYPATPQQIALRLGMLAPASKHAVFVAEASGTRKPISGEAGPRVVGWLHVGVTHLLEVDTRAEVNALVVAEGQRSLGAGARLIAAAEKWARKRGCTSMSVRSNVIRERAHRFYQRNGYQHYKTQKAFRKPL
jgi:GNAT superfamily N-acetyltransferase